MAESPVEARREACNEPHPSNQTVLPCDLLAGHDGPHYSSTGCAGSEVAWPADRPVEAVPQEAPDEWVEKLATMIAARDAYPQADTLPRSTARYRKDARTMLAALWPLVVQREQAAAKAARLDERRKAADELEQRVTDMWSGCGPEYLRGVAAAAVVVGNRVPSQAVSDALRAKEAGRA